MNKGHDWKVRDGSERDMERILSLRDLVFGEVERDKLDPRFWNWQMKENPDGMAWIYLAEDGQKIIGHLADLPKRFLVQGKLVLGTLTHDMMVHPDYRRKGVSSATAEYAIHRVEREKGMFMTAYSIREESLNSLLKVGWKEITKLPVLVFPIRFSGIVNRYLRSKVLSLLIGGVIRFFYFFLFGLRKKRKIEGTVMERVYEWDETYDLFWERAKSVHPIMGNRNRSFLTWRYLRHPTRDYVIYRALQKGEMKGYIVLRKVELLKFNSVVIVDLLALDDHTLSELVVRGIEHSREEGADLLGFMVPRPHPYDRSLRREGFLPSFKAFHFLVYSHGNEGILLDPKGWYVTWGDTDLI
ncbi:MAG: GNAT family N-acetyltransferase [Thermodesulfobacteriota bacterium]